MAKKPTKAQTAASARKEETEMLKVEAIQRATVEDPQSGGAQMVTEGTPKPAQVKAAKKAELDAQFGDAACQQREAIASATLDRQIRGY